MAEMTREQRERAAQVEIITDPVYWLERLLEHSLADHDSIEAKSVMKAIAALRQGWVRTAERVPEGDEHKEILGLYKGSLYKGKDYYLYDIVQIGWLRLHPEMYPYWTDLPAKPD